MSPTCENGHGAKQWYECLKCCGDGVSGHDCGDDCCLCFAPQDNIECDNCNGNGGWWRCYECVPVTADEEL